MESAKRPAIASKQSVSRRVKESMTDSLGSQSVVEATLASP